MNAFLTRCWQRPELFALSGLALLTRLWDVTNPHAVVFDEVYFKAYAGDYLTGSYYFDPHPPLGKLLLGGWAYLLHVSGPALAAGDPATALRILPALAGAAIIPLVYLILRQLQASRKVALLGATLLLLDNALTTESRFILTDSMLLAFGLGAVSLFLAARRRAGRARLVWLAAAALVAGLAGSTKWTGLAALGLIIFIWFVELPRFKSTWHTWLKEGAILILLPLAVYMSVFAVHFSLLHRTGQGDAFMSARFQSTLIGNAQYNPNVKLSFMEKFIDLNRAMRDAEASLKTATHPYGSPWYSWPFLKRPIYYWQGPTLANGDQGNIYLQGNPLVWWGALAGLTTIAARFAVLGGGFGRATRPIALLMLAWAVNFFPFANIHRVMFLYHYLFALIFSVMASVLALSYFAKWGKTKEGDVAEHEPSEVPDKQLNHPSTPHVQDEPLWNFHSPQSAWLYAGIIIFALAGFAYFAPLTYGWPLSSGQLMQHVWLTTWR